ncbi:MAG: hypothetical protein RIB03_11735 [Henriciella sp.]|uniref:hypothetical protein n=1 Tax=Henriciella sp. TaxID=1968823 RepID=UPI0032ED5924
MKRTALMAACIGLAAACASQPEPAPAPPGDTPSEDNKYSDDFPQSEPSPIPSRPRSSPDYYDPNDLPAPAAGYGSSGSRVTKDFLPYIDIAIDEDAANSNWGIPLEDLYTRIRIVTLDPQARDIAGTASGKYTEAPAQRNYKDESRGWLSRMMGSKEVSRALLAEFEIKKPDVTATEALFSASFSSNREQGESWSTDQSLALYATPWFKVSSNTTLTAKLRMQLSDERESSGATANVMASLTSAASLIAPASSLVTYFSAPSMLEASNFLDTSVSTLFGRSITEQTISTLALKSWTEKPILVVYAAMPDPKDIRNTKDRDMLGGWAIYLDAPIVSVFTSATQADDQGYDEWPDYRGTVGADILAFKVGDELTVYDYIFSRLDLFDRISNLNEAPEADLARLICTRIERGLSEIGFNAADSAAGVWAAATSDQFTSDASALLTDPRTCVAMTRWANLNGVVTMTEETTYPTAPDSDPADEGADVYEEY